MATEKTPTVKQGFEKYRSLKKINIHFGKVDGKTLIEQDRDFEIEQAFGDHLVKEGLAKKLS